MKSKLQPFDYAVMIGGPVIFIALMIAAWTILIGPKPTTDPIRMMHDGVVKSGMTRDQVEGLVGPPKSVETSGDGQVTLRYQRSRWDNDRKMILAEDAYVALDSTERVLSISFDTREPPVPK